MIVACPDHEACLELGPSRGGEENTKTLRVFSSFFSVSPCDRFQRENDRGACHSYRRQTTGSCRAARQAGTIPKITPVAIDTPKATNTESGETIVRMSAARSIA